MEGKCGREAWKGEGQGFSGSDAEHGEYLLSPRLQGTAIHQQTLPTNCWWLIVLTQMAVSHWASVWRCSAPQVVM